jgi:chemotaxis protein MotD
MTKLNGTSAQPFADLAESINARGIFRSGKGTGAKSAKDSSFHDLLHTVSNPPKRTANDKGGDGVVKAGTLRTRLAQLTERDEIGDETVHERTEAAEESKSSAKQAPLDHVAKLDVQSRAILPTIVGQELAAVPAVKPQAPLPAADKKDVPAREERSSARREVQGVSVARAATADIAPSAPRPHASAPQATPTPPTPPAAPPQDGAAPSKATPAVPGFEAVAANVERAARAAARQAMPEAIKVTVVQQETHLPPVQFSAPQQVANAVVAELKDSPVPASSATPDLGSAQGNAPDQPLKILTIHLEPPALGNVTVRLRLVGAEVSVHLAAQRKDTSQMLDQQRASIRELMQSAGYVADVAPVQHGSLDGFQAGSGQSQPLAGQQQQSAQSQGTFDGSGTSSGQSEDGARQARQERQPNQETRHEQDVAPHIRRGPVYL